MAKKPDYENNLKKLQQAMRNKLHELGYGDVTDFAKKTGLDKHVSFETIRRAFNSNDRPVAPPTLALILRSLLYLPSEIRNELQLSGDTIYYTLLPASEAGEELSHLEQLCLDTCREVIRNGSEARNDLANSFDIISRANKIKSENFTQVALNLRGTEAIHAQIKVKKKAHANTPYSESTADRIVQIEPDI